MIYVSSLWSITTAATFPDPEPLAHRVYSRAPFVTRHRGIRRCLGWFILFAEVLSRCRF